MRTLCGAWRAGDAVFELGVETRRSPRAAAAGHENVVLAHQTDLPGKDFEGDLRCELFDAVENVAHRLDGAEHVATSARMRSVFCWDAAISARKLLDRDLLRLRESSVTVSPS